MAKNRNIRVSDETWSRWKECAARDGFPLSIAIHRAMNTVYPDPKYAMIVPLGHEAMETAARERSLKAAETLNEGLKPVPPAQVRTPVVPAVPGVQKASFKSFTKDQQLGEK